MLLEYFKHLLSVCDVFRRWQIILAVCTIDCLDCNCCPWCLEIIYQLGEIMVSTLLFDCEIVATKEKVSPQKTIYVFCVCRNRRPKSRLGLFLYALINGNFYAFYQPWSITAFLSLIIDCYFWWQEDSLLCSSTKKAVVCCELCLPNFWPHSCVLQVLATDFFTSLWFMYLVLFLIGTSESC